MLSHVIDTVDKLLLLSLKILYPTYSPCSFVWFTCQENVKVHRCIHWSFRKKRRRREDYIDVLNRWSNCQMIFHALEIDEMFDENSVKMHKLLTFKENTCQISNPSKMFDLSKNTISNYRSCFKFFPVRFLILKAFNSNTIWLKLFYNVNEFHS